MRYSPEISSKIRFVLTLDYGTASTINIYLCLRIAMFYDMVKKYKIHLRTIFNFASLDFPHIIVDTKDAVL